MFRHASADLGFGGQLLLGDIPEVAQQPKRKSMRKSMDQRQYSRPLCGFISL